MIDKKKIKKTNNYLINENINFPNVLLIKENKNKLITIEEALKEANNNNQDLICISPNSFPPVCKLINSKKFFFELKKKELKKKKECKEISISYNIEDNDLNFKISKAIKWLKNDNVVKFNLKMIGKEKKYFEKTYKKCEEIINNLRIISKKIELKNNNIKRHINSFYFYLYQKK